MYVSALSISATTWSKKGIGRCFDSDTILASRLGHRPEDHPGLYDLGM
jgi:nuclear transport factor 2 (NTF2) superfamily protein